MITFRCTEKVRRRFDLDTDGDELESTNHLGDWYANLLNVGRSRWVLCLSEKSLLPVLVPARKAEFPDSFPDRLAAVLEGIGVPEKAIQEEVEASSAWRFGKTRSRSVLGSLNDFAFQFENWLTHVDDPTAAAVELADMPCMPLPLKFPDLTVFSLLNVPGEPKRRRRA